MNKEAFQSLEEKKVNKDTETLIPKCQHLPSAGNVLLMTDKPDLPLWSS